MKPLRPFFKYFGSKCGSAKHYPAPTRESIIEPFAGSAGYALNYPNKRVILYDSDERVIRVWRYLITATPSEIMALPLLEPRQSIDTVSVSDDARLFLSCCVNTSPFRKSLAVWKGGNGSALWGERWREKVASQVTAIKHWEAHCCDYSDIQNQDATWFVDPPYQALQQHYRASKKKPIDFAHLGNWCRERRGQVIVCENQGADWLPFRELAEIRAVRNNHGGTSKEVIWTND